MYITYAVNKKSVGTRDKGIWTNGWAIKRNNSGGSVWSKTFGGNGYISFAMLF